MIPSKIKTCTCGCGRPVTKPENKYIYGHNRKGKKGKKQACRKTTLPEIRVCACSCKEPFQCPANSHQKYIQGHQIKGKNHPHYNPNRHNFETKICACGCGEAFKCLNISPKKWLPGHQNRGKNHPQWKGGIASSLYNKDWTQTLKRSIRERDHYMCQLCSSITNGIKAFSVHHIDYNKLNCNPINLITLCKNCHSKTNTHRKFWTEYFNKLILILSPLE